MKRLLQTMALCAAMLSGLAASAQSSPAFQFDIPAADLSTATQMFAATVGGDAIFDAYTARNVRTQPVRGRMTPESALNQMFAGTGLNYRYDAATRRVVVARR